MCNFNFVDNVWIPVRFNVSDTWQCFDSGVWHYLLPPALDVQFGNMEGLSTFWGKPLTDGGWSLWIKARPSSLHRQQSEMHFVQLLSRGPRAPSAATQMHPYLTLPLSLLHSLFLSCPRESHSTTQRFVLFGCTFWETQAKIHLPSYKPLQLSAFFWGRPSVVSQHILWIFCGGQNRGALRLPQFLLFWALTSELFMCVYFQMYRF